MGWLMGWSLASNRATRCWPVLMGDREQERHGHLAFLEFAHGQGDAGKRRWPQEAARSGHLCAQGWPSWVSSWKERRAQGGVAGDPAGTYGAGVKGPRPVGLEPEWGRGEATALGPIGPSKSLLKGAFSVSDSLFTQHVHTLLPEPACKLPCTLKGTSQRFSERS